MFVGCWFKQIFVINFLEQKMGKKKPDIDQQSIFDDTSISLPEFRSDLPDDTEGLTPEGKHKHIRRPSGGGVSAARIESTEKPKKKRGSVEDWEWISNH